MTKKGQNLIEFIFVFPILIVLIFGIIELGIFWKTVHSVQNLALEATANASNQVVSDVQNSNNLTDVDCTDESCFNFAVAKAIDIVKEKQGIIGMKDLTFSCSSIDGTGVRPYALYECNSYQIIDINGSTTPKLKLIVDYRNPYKNGVISQLIFQYKTLLLGASIALPNSAVITVIPRDIEISSTKIKQYNQY